MEADEGAGAAWGGMSDAALLASAERAHAKKVERKRQFYLRPLPAEPSAWPSAYGKRLASSPGMDTADFDAEALVRSTWEAFGEVADGTVDEGAEVWDDPRHAEVLGMMWGAGCGASVKDVHTAVGNYARSLTFDQVTELLEPLLVRHAKAAGWEGHLDTLNAVEADKRITFEEGPHIYRVDGIALPGSATGMIHDYFPHFDPQAVAAKMKLPNPKYMKEDGSAMNAAEIVAQWATGTAAAAGTRVHLWVEYACNAIAMDHEPIIPPTREGAYFRAWHAESVSRGWTPFRTEWRVYDLDLMLAGSVDMIYKMDDGSLAIVDWKNSKEIHQKGFYNRELRSVEKGYGPCKALDHCNMMHYFLQLTLYKVMLERLYGQRVSYIGLVVFHRNHPEPGWKWKRGVDPPEADRYLEFECKQDLTEVVDEILGERAARVSDFRRCARVLSTSPGSKVDLRLGDLFHCEEWLRGKFTLAHCIAVDKAMGAGIAVQFRARFGRPEKPATLRVGRAYVQTIKILAPKTEAQRTAEAVAAMFKAKAHKEEEETIGPPRYVMHLVTKERSARCLPTRADFAAALTALFVKVGKSSLEGIAMPKIGSGLDKLDFDGFVLPLILRLSAEHGVKVVVYIK